MRARLRFGCLEAVALLTLGLCRGEAEGVEAKVAREARVQVRRGVRERNRLIGRELCHRA